ncbi:hypothetical protein WA016_06864 [Myxococcus stipitatus]
MDGSAAIAASAPRAHRPDAAPHGAAPPFPGQRIGLRVATPAPPRSPAGHCDRPRLTLTLDEGGSRPCIGTRTVTGHNEPCASSAAVDEEVWVMQEQPRPTDADVTRKTDAAGRRTGLRRLIPWGRGSDAGTGTEEKARSMTEKARSMTRRARGASSSMRKQIRPSWKVSVGARVAQRWARHQLKEHAVPLGLSALTVGVLAAALLPIPTSGERHTPSEPSTRQPQKEARTRSKAHARGGKPQTREAASTKSEAHGERPRDARRRPRTSSSDSVKPS